MKKIAFSHFGKVCGAAGVQGFFGEGYRFHTFTRPNFAGMSFTTKTFTIEERLGKEVGKGNALLRPDAITLAEFFPACVEVSFLTGHTLNAVGLSNCGLKYALEMGKLQARKEPFRLSFMAVGKTVSQREEEYRELVSLLKFHLSNFRAPFILQDNKSCPNVAKNAGADSFSIATCDPLDSLFVSEVQASVRRVAVLGLNHELKFSVTTAPRTVFSIVKEFKENVGICVSNTIPWGRFSDKIPWGKLFGSKVSPLAHLGGGGLSGPLLLDLVVEWLGGFRQLDEYTNVNAGGGVFRARDVDRLKHARANSVFVGTVATLRPWRLQSIIRRANEVF